LGFSNSTRPGDETPMTATLCIDVGGSHIRAAVIDATESLPSLRRKQVVSIRSLGWMNETLPQLVNPLNSDGIAARIGDAYEAIAVAVPGTVRDGKFTRPGLDLPRYLAKAFARESGMKTFAMNDAEAWAMGSVEFAAFGTWDSSQRTTVASLASFPQTPKRGDSCAGLRVCRLRLGQSPAIGDFRRRAAPPLVRQMIAGS
jgi:hypothetical protein